MNTYMNKDSVIHLDNATIVVREGTCETCCFFNEFSTEHCTIRNKKEYIPLIRMNGKCRLTLGLHYERLKGGV